jgi:hypothetical protein
VAISKLEEHSNSLEEMTLLSYVSGAKRNTYAAENCMGMFREQTLCAGMKRMELAKNGRILVDHRVSRKTAAKRLLRGL